MTETVPGAEYGKPLKEMKMDWIDEVIRDVAELPDRSSPSDWADAMLVTVDELRKILTEHAPRQ